MDYFGSKSLKSPSAGGSALTLTSVLRH